MDRIKEWYLGLETKWQIAGAIAAVMLLVVLADALKGCAG